MSLKLMCAFGLDMIVCPLVAWADGEHVHNKDKAETWWDVEESGFSQCPVEDIGLTSPYPTQGIHVWEGNGKSIGCGDLEYSGAWREATMFEISSMMRHESPFPRHGVCWLGTKEAG